MGSAQTLSLVRVGPAVWTCATLQTRESVTQSPSLFVYSAPSMHGQVGVAEAAAVSVDNCPATSVDCVIDTTSVESAAAWLDAVVVLRVRAMGCNASAHDTTMCGLQARRQGECCWVHK